MTVSDPEDWRQRVEEAEEAARQAKQRQAESAPREEAPKKLSAGFPRPDSEKAGAWKLLCSTCVQKGSMRPKEAEKYRARIPELDAQGIEYPVRIIQTGLCREHADAFFSENWDARMREARAGGNDFAVKKLESELQRWRAKGRQFYGKEG